MPRLTACRFCRVELETVALASGRAMVVCVTCQTMGFAHEAAHGAPHWPVELNDRRAHAKKSRPVRRLRAKK